MKAIKINKNQNITKKGFTIIEVVLVLAIAGLIFLMVFLALPALQRAQRDTQRKQDVAALHNWKANNKGLSYASLGDSKTKPLTSSDEYDKENGLNVSVISVENNPLNNYIGFREDNDSNKNDSSSSLSLNTSFIKTFKTRSDIVRLKKEAFEEWRIMAVVINFGCNNIEILKNGKTAVLKDKKPGAAAVVHFLESGGAYCQEA